MDNCHLAIKHGKSPIKNGAINRWEKHRTIAGCSFFIAMFDYLNGVWLQPIQHKEGHLSPTKKCRWAHNDACPATGGYLVFMMVQLDTVGMSTNCRENAFKKV